MAGVLFHRVAPFLLFQIYLANFEIFRKLSHSRRIGCFRESTKRKFTRSLGTFKRDDPNNGIVPPIFISDYAE